MTNVIFEQLIQPGDKLLLVMTNAVDSDMVADILAGYLTDPWFADGYKDFSVPPCPTTVLACGLFAVASSMLDNRCLVINA